MFMFDLVSFSRFYNLIYSLIKFRFLFFVFVNFEVKNEELNQVKFRGEFDHHFKNIKTYAYLKLNDSVFNDHKI